MGLVLVTKSHAAWSQCREHGTGIENGFGVTALLWQRFTARRELTVVPVDGRGCAGAGGRHVSTVVREPEASWWELQSRASLTVAAVREADAGWHPESLAGRLAEIATQDELLLIFGASRRAGTQRMVAELREQLPAHDVVPMPVRHRHGGVRRDAATVERLLDVGSLPVVVTPPMSINDVTAEIAGYLRVDRVLRVLSTGGDADLFPVWQRRQEVRAG